MPEKKPKKAVKRKKTKVEFVQSVSKTVEKSVYMGSSNVNILAVNYRLAGNNCDNKELCEFMDILAEQERQRKSMTEKVRV